MADSQPDPGKVPTPGVVKDGPPPEGGGKEAVGKVLFGKHEFPDLETAGKSYESAVAELNRTKQSLHEHEQEMTVLRQQAELSAKLDKLVANTTPKEAAPDFDAFVEQQAQSLGWDETETARFKAQAMLTSGWLGEQDKRWQQRFESATSDYQKSLAELREAQERLAPDYLAHREDIDRLSKEYGLPLAKAKKLYGEILEKASPTAPPRGTPPTGPDASRVTPPRSERQPYLSPEEREVFKAQHGLTEDDLNELERDRERREREVQEREGRK